MTTKKIKIKKCNLSAAVAEEVVAGALSARAHVKNIEIRIESDRLKFESGGLVEDPPLLEMAEVFLDKITTAYKNQVTESSIIGIEGAYLVCLKFDIGQVDAFENDPARMLAGSLGDHKIRIESNALERTPAGAAELGIGKKQLGMVEALAEIATYSPSVTIQSQDGEKIDAQSASLDAIKALPKPVVSPSRVDGKITAIGIGKENGVRLEVGSTMLHVDGLSIDKAFGHLKDGSHVRGLQVTVDGGKVLQGAGFYTPNDSLL